MAICTDHQAAYNLCNKVLCKETSTTRKNKLSLDLMHRYGRRGRGSVKKNVCRCTSDNIRTIWRVRQCSRLAPWFFPVDFPSTIAITGSIADKLPVYRIWARFYSRLPLSLRNAMFKLISFCFSFHFTLCSIRVWFVILNVLCRYPALLFI